MTNVEFDLPTKLIVKIIKVKGTSYKNNKSLSCRIILNTTATKYIGFNPVIFSEKDLSIKRPSIDSIKTYSIIQANQINFAYNEDLLGEYNLIKENEDLFYLEKI